MFRKTTIIGILSMLILLLASPAAYATEVSIDACNTEELSVIVDSHKDETVDVMLEDTDDILDLEYWHPGENIDTDYYVERLHHAIDTVPTPGGNLCAAWVSSVYASAGLGGINGDARDHWAWCGASDNPEDIQDGMIIAVPHSPHGSIGWTYGHVGILYKNPNYQEPDSSINDTLSTLYHQLAVVRKNEYETDYETYCQDSNHLIAQIEEIQNANHITTKEVTGVNCTYDIYGNEKWYVAQNVGSITKVPLSEWLTTFNVTNEVKWGWGHYDTSLHPQFNYYM